MTLADIPLLERELDTTIAGVKGVDYRTRGGTASELPSLVAWAPAAARDDLKAVLVCWVRFCHDERVRNQSQSQQLPADTLSSAADWLAWRVDGLSLLDIGPDAVEEITTAVARCRRMIDRAPEREYSGQCGSTLEDDTLCQRDLYVRPGVPRVTCPACGTDWDVAARRLLLLERAHDVLATASEISRAVSILGVQPLTADRVRQWASRKRILVQGHDRSGKAMYRVGDAIDLLAGITPDTGTSSA